MHVDPAPASAPSLRAADPCPLCKQPVDVTSPNWLTFNFDFNKKRVTWEEREHPPDLCLDCTANRLPFSAREAWAPTGAMLRDAVKEIYLRPDVTLFHHRTQNTHVHPRTEGVYQIDYFFIILNGYPHPSWKVARIPLRPDDGTSPFTLLIPRIILTLEGVDPKVILTWDLKNFLNQRSQFEIVDWEQATRRDLLRLFEVAATFARKLPAGRPRRPTFSKQHYIDLYRQSFSERGRPSSMEAFCDSVDIPQGTLRDNLKRWGLKWSEFREEAELL